MKQITTEPPDNLIKAALIIITILIYGFIGWAILKSHQSDKTAPDSPEIRLNDKYYLIGGNSLKAIVPPYMIKPRVYGIMLGNDLDYRQAELLDDLWSCEASNRHEGVWGDNGRAYGAFQFWQPTWNHFCEGSRSNFEDQLNCARFMIFELEIGKQHWQRCWKTMELDKYF